MMSVVNCPLSGSTITAVFRSTRALSAGHRANDHRPDSQAAAALPPNESAAQRFRRCQIHPLSLKTHIDGTQIVANPSVKGENL